MTATREALRTSRRRTPPQDPLRRFMLLGAVGLSVFLLYLPARQLVGERLRVARLQARLQAVDRENRRLEAEVRRLQDPAALELEARQRLGLARPGERAYLLVPQPTPRPSPPPPTPAAWRRWWGALVRLLRGRH